MSKSCLCSIILISLLKKGNETRIEINAHWFEQCIKTKFIFKFLKDNCFNHNVQFCCNDTQFINIQVFTQHRNNIRSSTWRSKHTSYKLAAKRRTRRSKEQGELLKFQLSPTLSNFIKPASKKQRLISRSTQKPTGSQWIWSPDGGEPI